MVLEIEGKQKASSKFEKENIYSEIDPLALYLKQISKYKLLTPKEEQEVAANIQEIKKQLVLLQTEDFNEDEKAMKMNQIKMLEAELKHQKNIMVHANLRLVVSVAKNYQHRGLGLIDLIDEGNIGLLEAVDRFSPEYNCRFSTYGIWWIRQAIIKSLADKGRMIRVPVHMLNTINKCFLISKMLTQELGREPTALEISNYTGEKVEKVEEYLKLVQDTTSLDTNVDDGSPTQLGDLLTDENSEIPIENVFSAMLSETISHVLEDFTERETAIIKMRFGLNGKNPMTLTETGRMLGITRERVRQIQRKMLEKLREREELVAYNESR
ncbi:MAG: sigma-70 family RNA polymerase sigma factor [Spirochaetaceae bacterium]|nr:sigma-70 family RNA polymerase sigma factor [Spirochaetaceae bacterium]